MAFYARLKKEVNGKKVEKGVWLGNKILYPDDPRWMKRDDVYINEAKADERIEILANKDELNAFNKNENEELEAFLTGNRASVIAKVKKIIDKFYLEKLLAKANELNKTVIAESIEDQLESLKQ